MTVKNTLFQKKKTINIGGKITEISTPLVMGILNTTPDSFFDGGKYITDTKIENRLDEIISQEADIIDIGAVSTRPGAKNVSAEEEIRRLTHALEITRKKYPDAVVSIDTFRSEVAAFTVGKFNVQIINDISGGNLDGKMFETIARLNVPYVLMHMQGTPEMMQKNPTYKNVVSDIMKFFASKIDEARKIGINDIIIDPGFGFGKTFEHNFELLSRLDEFKIFELPVLAGISRKAMIYKTLGIKPEEALTGTITLNTIALMKGANILRVHDVSEAKQCIRLVEKIN